MRLYLIISFIFFSTKLMGCDCIDIYDYNTSNEVFIGKVIKRELIHRGSSTLNTIIVSEIYKGNLRKRKKIKIISRIDVCGYDWEIGEYYLIFAEGKKRRKRKVNMCTLTTRINYKYDLNGNWIGIPNKDQVSKWWSLLNEDKKLINKWID